MLYSSENHLYRIILLAIILQACVFNLMAQDEDHDHDHQHEEEMHKHRHGTEIGFAVGAVPLHEEGIKPGFHVHYLRPFKGTNQIRYGIGGEMVMDEHTHLTASVSLNFLIWRGLQFSLAPGILFLNHEDDWEKHLSTHLELLYEIDINGIHMGPLLEYAVSSAENHYLLGIHIGFQIK